MSARATADPAPASRSSSDPVRVAWNLLTNVKFAVVLVGTAATASMLGVLLPQVPLAARQSEAARSAWLESKREGLGVFTDPLYSLGLLDVFHAWWFNALWLVVILAVTVCSVSRFRPTWRSVQRPQRRVPERYFETAHHRASFTHEGGAEAVASALRKRRYRVREEGSERGAAYLFAERFGWSAYGTFLSHLALLMLLVGALLTRFGGFDTTLVLAETEPASPVFDEPGPNQIFMRTIEAHRGLDEDGHIVDFRSTLELRRGEEVITCQSTVNDPCKAFGYRFHQAAWFDDFARLVITSPDGRVLFDDVLDFESRNNVVPHLRVTTASGDVLFDQVLPQMGTAFGSTDDPADVLATASLAFRATDSQGEIVAYFTAWANIDGEIVLSIAGQDLAPADLLPGESVTTGSGYKIDYTDWAIIPAVRVLDMPGSLEGGAVIQMPTDQAGVPYLFISGVDQRGLALIEARPEANSAGYAYEFQGKVDGAGINVRRDPGDTFIWLAVGMALVGLSMTFYVPRRRLWVRVTSERTNLAGIAERTTRFDREMRLLGAELGSDDALLPEDTEDPT